MLKILKIPGDQCIEGYPDRLMPTLLVYGPNEFRSQVVGLAELGGNNTRVPGMTTMRLSFLSYPRHGKIRREDWGVNQGGIESSKGQRRGGGVL